MPWTWSSRICGRLQLYRMKHVDAEDVARKLQELGIISKLPENPASLAVSHGAVADHAASCRVSPGRATPPTPEAAGRVDHRSDRRRDSWKSRRWSWSNRRTRSW